MSEITVMVLVLLICFYISSVIFNYAVMFTYFQRNRLANCDKLAKRHALYALAYAWPGFIVTLTVALSCEFPRFGLKLHPGETMRPGNNWWIQMQEVKHRQEAYNIYHEKVDGTCIDLWRD